MRLADQIDWARHRLLDTEKVVFPDNGRIISALNVGAWQVQKAVMKVAPDKFRRHTFRNLEVGKYRYQLPRGHVRMKQVFVNYGGGEIEATPGMEMLIERGTYGNDLHYVTTGGECVLSMKPDKSVEDGLHFLEVPVISMADDDDDLEDQGLSSALHMAVVLWAVKLLKPEGGEENKDLDAEILSVLGDISTCYGMDGSGDAVFIDGTGLGLGEDGV